MTFTNSVSTCFKKYYTFSGRALRSEYWWFQVFAILGSIVLGVVDSIVFGGSYTDTGVLGTIFSLAIIIPTISVTCRRLHDINRSGWWQIGWVLVLLLGYLAIFGLIMTTASFGGVLVLVFVVLIGAGVLWPLYWLASSGTEGNNEYGPDPRA